MSPTNLQGDAAPDGMSPPQQAGHSAAVLAWFLCALLYFYQYAVRSAPGVMAAAMQATWGNNPVPTMNAYYYMVYAFSALLAGALLDRYGARLTMPFAAAFVAICTMLLATGNERLAILGFTLQGIGAVFGFVGAIYVAAKLLPPASLPTFVGLSQMLGMAGAAVGSKPIAYLIDPDGGRGWAWQSVWPTFAIAGGILAVLLWIVLPRSESNDTPFSLKGLVHPYQVVFENPQTYLCGLIGGLLFAPTTIGAMVWATQFLHQGENLSTSSAASLASMVPIGWIIGCPSLGFISDKIGRRKPVLITGAIVMGLATFAAIYLEPSLGARYLIALVLGVASGAAMIPFSIVKEANPAEVKGSASGAMNFLCFMVTGLLSPVLQRQLTPGSGDDETLAAFQHGLVPLAFGIAVAIVLAFFLRETGNAAKKDMHASGQQLEPSVSIR